MRWTSTTARRGEAAGWGRRVGRGGEALSVAMHCKL